MRFIQAHFHPSVLGLAILLTINATLLWGGSFPFLPMEMQTTQVLNTFYLLQSVAFLGTFLTNAVAAYFVPSLSRRMLVFFNGAPIFCGCAALITTLYLPAYTMLLVGTGALLLGAGSAGYLILLQRFFASQEPELGIRYIIYGTGLSAAVYFLLALMPIAITSYLIMLVLVPLCGLSIVLSTREIDFAQPMFEDNPQQNSHVYLHTIRGYWPSAVSVGCLGFVGGVVRGCVLTEPSMGLLINGMSILGALLSSVVLMLLWRKSSFHFDVVGAYRMIFPVIITSFLLLPFLGEGFLDVFSALLHMVFTFALTIIMIQSAQASRDVGINPLFIYGFIGTVVYIMVDLGFILGSYSLQLEGLGYNNIIIVALASSWLLGLAMYAVRGKAEDVSSLLRSLPSRVEFPPSERRDALDATAGAPDVTGIATAGSAPVAHTLASVAGSANAATVAKAARAANNTAYRDLTSKRCAALKQLYQLSSREAEVMEYIARGNSVARISAELVVSENTVRTHSKRIYTKLGVHKRQDLLDLLELVAPVRQ